ncbi:retrotransposon protein, putative, ty3-gypsy subclass, partial [Tanacetum coccineum]
MHFLLTTLKVVNVLTTPMPKLLEDATVEATRIRAKWENDDYICRGHILNGSVWMHPSSVAFSFPAAGFKREARNARAVNALLPDLTAQITNELYHNGAGSSVDAENWIAHIEKLFEVLGCADEFKARLTSYKLEGDALSWWKAVKQAKGDETYVATLPWKDFHKLFFFQYFPRSEQQKYEREYHTIRQRDGEPSGEFMKRFLRRDGNGDQKSRHDRDQQYNRSSGSSGQKRYSDYASSPPCETCRKLHPGRACYRVTRACFSCGSTGHMARHCPRNDGNGGEGSGNDKQATRNGRVFDSTTNHAASSSGSVWMHPRSIHVSCLDICLSSWAFLCLFCNLIPLIILDSYSLHYIRMTVVWQVLSGKLGTASFLEGFKYTLKPGKDDLSLVQLGSHLRIEESLRAQDSDKGKGKEVVGPSVNMAEEGKNKNNKQNKGKKRDFKEHGSGSSSNKKPKLECWKCGKTGHFKRDSVVVIRRTQMLVVREKGLRTIPKTKVDAIAWWIDSGSTTH